jgi:hypothetical protein
MSWNLKNSDDWLDVKRSIVKNGFAFKILQIEIPR